MTQRPRFWIKTSIFCVIFSLFHGGSSNTINGTTNGHVTLQPKVTGRIDGILWKHKGNKMVEWDRTAEHFSEHLTFIGRTKLDIETGDVTIVKLTKDDSGDYEAEVVIDAIVRSAKRIVEVIDPVTKAKITCSSNASITMLHCEAEGDLLSYSWSGPGLQTEMRGQTGPQITKEKDQNSVYTCVVNNPVSNVNVAYKSCNCFAAEPAVTTTNEGNHHTIIGELCGILGVGVAVVGGFFCYKRKIKGQDANKHITEETGVLTSSINKNIDVSPFHYNKTKGIWIAKVLATDNKQGSPKNQTSVSKNQRVLDLRNHLYMI